MERRSSKNRRRKDIVIRWMTSRFVYIGENTMRLHSHQWEYHHLEKKGFILKYHKTVSNQIYLSQYHFVKRSILIVRFIIEYTSCINDAKVNLVSLKNSENKVVLLTQFFSFSCLYPFSCFLPSQTYDP